MLEDELEELEEKAYKCVSKLIDEFNKKHLTNYKYAIDIWD